MPDPYRSVVISADGVYTGELRGDSIVDVLPNDHATERLEREKQARQAEEARRQKEEDRR